jgi:hypothetical protein
MDNGTQPDDNNDNTPDEFIGWLKKHKLHGYQQSLEEEG